MRIITPIIKGRTSRVEVIPVKLFKRTKDFGVAIDSAISSRSLAQRIRLRPMSAPVEQYVRITVRQTRRKDTYYGL